MKSTRQPTTETFARRRQRRARWLFVWLLPFVWSSIGHDLLHGSECPENAILQRAVQNSPQKIAPASKELAPETECFASDWAGASTAWDATEFPLIALSSNAAPVPLRFLLPQVKVAPSGWASRGPPA